MVDRPKDTMGREIRERRQNHRDGSEGWDKWNEGQGGGKKETLGKVGICYRIINFDNGFCIKVRM